MTVSSFDEIIWNRASLDLELFATSEPMMGSDVAGIQCRAKEEGDHYVLNGTKYWITNSLVADYMTISSAKTGCSIPMEIPQAARRGAVPCAGTCITEMRIRKNAPTAL